MGSQKKDALWRNQENKIITWTQAQKLKSAFDSGLYYIVSSYIEVKCDITLLPEGWT